MISSMFSNQQDLLQAWVWAMVHSVWIGLVLAFIFYTYLGLNPSCSSKTKYRVGISLFTLLPVSVLIAFILSFPEQIPSNLSAAVTVGGTLTTSVAVSNPSSNLPDFLNWMSGIEQHVQVIFLLWSLGVILFSIRMAMGYHQIYRLRSQSMVIEVPQVINTFKKLLAKSGLREKIALVSSPKVDIPLTIGHLKPMILLPIGLINKLSPEETQAILAHEIAHILRKDYLQNLLISTLEILFFYHPSVWWFSATIKTLREQCCDDIALELGAERIALSKALIQLEENNPGPAFALAFAHKNQLLNRIQRLFQNPGQSTLRNEYSLSRSQAPLLICGIALVWLMTNPLAGMNASMDMMRLSKSFIWDRVQAPVDTVKPKSRIEKISRDNGKQKIELSLENKEIKELKVDEKVIPPADYDKYKMETEALQKELAEIEMPVRRTRAFRDFDGPEVYEFRFNDSFKMAPRVFSGTMGRAKAFSFTPKAPLRSGDGHEFWFGEGGGKSKNFFYHEGDSLLWGSKAGGTHWIFEGDTSGMLIDGDQLIIKNEKSNIIIDLRDKLKGKGAYKLIRPGSGNGGWTPGLYDLDLLSPDGDLLRSKIRINSQAMEELARKQQHLNRDLAREHEWKAKEQMEKLKSLEKMQHGLMEELGADEFKALRHLRSLAPDHEGAGFGLNRKSKLQDVIEQKLVRDGYLGSQKNYEFKISAKELRINGKKQDEKSYNQFKSIIEDHTGIELEDGAMISFSGTLEDND